MQTHSLNKKNQKLGLYLSLFFLLSALFIVAGGWLPRLFLSHTTVYFVHYVIALAIMVGTLAIGGIWIRLNTETTVWMHPPFLMTIWTIVYMWILGFYPFFNMLRNPWLMSLFSNDPKVIANGVYIFPLGLVSLWLVYLLTYHVIRSSPKWMTNLGGRSIPASAIWVIYSMSLSAQLIKVVSTGIAIDGDRGLLGDFSTLWQWFTYAESLHLLVLALLVEKTVTEKRSWTPLVVVILIQVLFGYLSGFMKPIIWIAVIVTLSLLGNGVKVRNYMFASIPLLMLAIGSVPIAEGIRAQVGRFDSRNLREVTQAAVEAYENSWGSSAEDGFQRVQDKLLGRQIGIAHTPTIIYVSTPTRFDYQGFAKFVAFPTYIIPRAIWPSKPVLVSGNWFNVNYLNAPATTDTSAAITFFGEGYMFSSWLGVITTGLLFGMLLAILQRWFLLAKLKPFYFALIPLFIDIESQASIAFIGLIQQAVFMLVIYMVVSTLFKPKAAPKFTLANA
ncbi:MAG: hypothetical protein ACPG8W_11935 [Candidatus Promineifilaceae bacterium]